ncbi:nipped-B-like protein B [Thalassophryne amazonica]|uniref:nipped-B-like protein B n=1 Tax=Thalassophryne amazonica TaxID=390379 RepID=UPI00147180AA|nr:nipped-B-like protein B [Thalassophryne amazonica]
MNGDMPHVPITSLAGIASLTDLLNQLPLPSPLPATTAKSLLYNGRISEEVSSLLVCRDENLVNQLAHSLNQVSTEHIELKDNLGNDEPEGDLPILLQTVLSRNPKIFRDKSVMQQPMIQQYKMSQNQVHGSPASNYQQATVPQSPLGCFTSPQSGSGTRFVAQQNSPVPSPYAPQSPADYMQYNHPPSYPQQLQIQQVAVRLTNIHDSKISGHLSSNSSKHNANAGSSDDYMNMDHRLENEFVCSPVEREDIEKTGFRPITMQSPPSFVSADVPPDLLISSDFKKKPNERNDEKNEEMGKNALYDIVSYPSKDSARLTIKLSRVRFSDVDQSGQHPSRPNKDSDHDPDLISDDSIRHFSRTAQDMSNRLGAEEQVNCQQVPAQPNTSEPTVISGDVFDDSEIDALSEVERVEREATTERERSYKEVQDKDKPLKKRKQDSYPQEAGPGMIAEASEGPNVQGINTGSRLTPKKISPASNGATRPTLMVSIDLVDAGRGRRQPVVVLGGRNLCEDQLRKLKSKTNGKGVKVLENAPGINTQHVDDSRTSGSDSEAEALQQKLDIKQESKSRQDGKMDISRECSDGIQPSQPEQKEKQHNRHQSHVPQPETPNTIKKADCISRNEHHKHRDKNIDGDKDRDRRDKEIDEGTRDKVRQKKDKDIDGDVGDGVSDLDEDIREKDRDRRDQLISRDVRGKNRYRRVKDIDVDIRGKVRDRKFKEIDRDKRNKAKDRRDKDIRDEARDRRDKDTDGDIRDKDRGRREKNADEDIRDKDRGRRDKNADEDIRDKDRGRRDKNADEDIRDKDRGRRDKNADEDIRDKDRSRGDKNADEDIRVKDRSRGDKNSDEDIRDKDRSRRDKNADEDIRDKDRNRRDKNADDIRDKDRSRRDKNADDTRDKDRDGDIKDKDRERRDKDRERKIRDKDEDRRIKNRDEDRRDKDRDSEKKHKMVSEGNFNRHSPELHSKTGSSTDNQGRRSSTDQIRQRRTDGYSLQIPKTKEERKHRDEGTLSKDENKRHPFESKPSKFPPQLLGGNSGSLKNFVIPKLKRDGNEEGLQLANKLMQCWSEPLVRLERVSLAQNLNKGSKPVVVLDKLSVDEVKRIIKERKNAHNSKYRNWSSYDKSGREIYFEGSNKRRRGMTNKRPKYAEIDSDEDDDDDDSETEISRKRRKKDQDKTWEQEKRKGQSGYQGWSSGDSDSESPPPSLRDVARKLKKREKLKKRNEYEPKLTLEEMMDSSAFKRFIACLDNILENLEDVELHATDDDDDDDGEIPQELLLGKHQLSELGSVSAKIKAMGIFNKLPSSKLVKMLNILEKNIQDSVKLSTLMNHDNDSMEEERLWRDLIMERVTKSADACLTALSIMTSPHMPKAVYIEDVIERVLQYTKFHLQNTIYPQYDAVYRGGKHNSKSKRAKCSSHKQKVVVALYNKVCEILNNISDLLEIQLLTDTTILQVSTLGITPFFVENVSELQLSAIPVVTAVFSRYKKHRQLILEEIFTSLARLPTSKRSLRNFQLNSTDMDGEPMYIQMVTALVLQLIQCVVHLPSEREDDHDKKVDKDILVTNSYETAMRTAQNFLSVFLKKCGSKQAEENYRPLFENFVQDLLSTVNKPEWPAAELLLSLLGRLLVHQFSNKQTEMALRVASLDYLGTVASRLRKDAVTTKMDQRAIDRILEENPGNDEIQQLQKALLDYLNKNMETEPSLLFARKFYIAQWFRDTKSEEEKATMSQNKDEDTKGRRLSNDIEMSEEILEKSEARRKFLRKIIKTPLSQLSSQRINSDTLDYEDSSLIVRYLASMRPFAQSFDIYLSQILRVLGESAIAVRTKAMKCLSEVVAVDPSILSRVDMQRGVHCRLMDSSTSVREAAVELLGRFVLSRPELIEQYYDMLIERILDTGISVRKRVIKILRDICLEQPSFRKITEMCVKMIRRVNDEEGIKKLVNETFQKLWFTPTPSHDKDGMTRKILNITDVVAACKDSGYDWFEQLLQNLLKSEEAASHKPAKKACIQLVDNLVEHILKYDESLAECEDRGVSSDRVVACTTTLYLFSKISPHLMVQHAMTIQPYLTTKCNTQNDFMVICNVAKILELVIPLMDQPSETFLTTIEEDLMKLIIKYGMTVVQHCVSCLGAVVNKVTHNYKFVWACFNRFYGALAKLKMQHQEDPSSSALATNKPALLRSLFTVGALCRHFDFDLEDFKGSTKIVIKDKVLELLLYFTAHEDEEVQIKAIIALGFQFIMHPELMFVQDVKVLYNSILSEECTMVSLKIQVLKNLQTYLQEEDSRMQEADREWKKLSKQEDLKEMGDISSGMSSSIMQIYLKQVLEAFFHSQSTVRHFALNVITLTLSQGLIHPVQCVPYLIAMGTDPEQTMKNKADNQLVEIDKKYSGFIHMKAVAGLKMSYQVQEAITKSTDAVIRGFRKDDADSALCCHLYTMVRGNRQHRRAFLLSLLNLFDDSSKTEVNMLLFVADNLACFPYQTQEEPLFIMHHVDITLSISGSNLLQSFKESLQKAPVRQQKAKKEKRKKKKKSQARKYCSENEDSEEEQSSSTSSSSEDEMVQRRKKSKQSAVSDFDSDLEDEDAVMERLPENPGPLLDFATASQGIILLLVLKQHLKNLYGFSDSKILKYSPTESAKVYDKAVNRKNNVHFNPRQTLDFLKRDLTSSDLTYEIKRNIVKQYLDFKVLMEHLDPDEEDEEGEASANARNKAISSLLRVPKTQNHNRHNQTPVAETDEEESEDEDPPAQPNKDEDSDDDSDPATKKVEVMDVVAIYWPKYKDRPQIAKVIQKVRTGYSVQWMSGTYSGPWTEAKKRDGRKMVPWVDTVKESDIIYKKISLTSGHKLTNGVAQTLRALYAAKEGKKS